MRLLSGDSQAEASKSVERNIGRRLRTEADAANYSAAKRILVQAPGSTRKRAEGAELGDSPWGSGARPP